MIDEDYEMIKGKPPVRRNKVKDGEVVEVSDNRLSLLPEGTPVWVDQDNQYYVYRNGVKVSLADIIHIRKGLYE